MANVHPLRLARERAGLGLREAAGRLGTHPSSVVDWEYGRTTPALAALNRMADLYGVSLDELVGRGTAPLPPEGGAA